MKIIEDIRRQLIKDFEGLSWMDNTTTKNAEEKVGLKNVYRFLNDETYSDIIWSVGSVLIENRKPAFEWILHG